MLGSHNSLSVYPPKNILGKVFRWMAQCQDKPLYKQVQSKVQAFDIRVKRKGDKYIVCHGLAEFDTNVNENLFYLSLTQKITNRQVYIRLGLESFIFPPSKKEIELFNEWYDTVVNYFPDVKFAKYIRGQVLTQEFSDGTKYIELQHSPQTIIEAIKGPRKLLSKQSTYVDSENVVMFQDFV